MHGEKHIFSVGFELNYLSLLRTSKNCPERIFLPKAFSSVCEVVLSGPIKKNGEKHYASGEFMCSALIQALTLIPTGESTRGHQN